VVTNRICRRSNSRALQSGDSRFYCVHIEETTGHRASADPVEVSMGLASGRRMARSSELEIGPSDRITNGLQEFVIPKIVGA